MKFPITLRRHRRNEEPYFQYSSQARFYEFEEQYLICSVAGIAETASITLLNIGANSAAIGEAAIKHLDEFQKESPKSLQNEKSTDWVAFQKSGAKSVKAFEKKLWHFDLALMNSAVLIWAKPRKSLHHDLSTYMTARRFDTEGTGEAIRKAIEAAKALRDEGLV